MFFSWVYFTGFCSFLSFSESKYSLTEDTQHTKESNGSIFLTVAEYFWQFQKM